MYVNLMTIKTMMPILLLIITQGVFAEQQDQSPIGRLFTRTFERQQLNADRRFYKEGKLIQQSAIESAKNVIAPEFKYNGVVIRKNGSREIWVNGQPVRHNTHTERFTDQAYHFEASRTLNARMTLPDGQKIHLRPGQVYQVERQSIVEAYLALEKNGQDTVPTDDPRQGADTAQTQTPAEEKSPPIEFDEGILAKEISKIQLLEERILELEKQQQNKVIRN